MHGGISSEKENIKKLKQRKQRIQYRLRNINFKEQSKPMFAASNINYDIADRTHGLTYGGIGAMQLPRLGAAATAGQTNRAGKSN
jgi:hypothetical protein